METEDVDSYEVKIRATIEKAKKFIVSRNSEDFSKREWLSVSVDSYGSKSNRIEFLVLEGSPPRGYIVVNRNTATVKAYDSRDRVVKTFKLPF